MVSRLVLWGRCADNSYKFAVSLYPVIGRYHFDIFQVLRRQLCCEPNASGRYVECVVRVPMRNASCKICDGAQGVKRIHNPTPMESR